MLAAIQMNSGTDVTTNLAKAETLIEQAVKQGATTVFLPEEFSLLAADYAARNAHAETLGDGPVQARCSQWAKRFNVELVAGTIPTLSLDERPYSTCIAFNTQGVAVAKYHKMHLFDVDVADEKKNYRESERTKPGNEVICAKLSCGSVGLSVCYDIRFPELYRAMGEVNVISCPAAFTVPTGEAHWHILMRARAIENLCYLVAAAQVGHHDNGRVTYGHSLIVSPWGEVLAELPEGEGVILAPLDLEGLATTRAEFPVLSHRVVD